ncbi:MAG TPA: acyclic terpene utilization AtuA family protein [Jatrophihabitans sp.]|nr:acyclic terpene utilization AtuA family protein [Jatrophihabitans sp.]
MTAAPAVPLRIGNASGFYGDRFSAVQEMLDGGELDVLTGDYLAELTMLILARDRARDPELGYAKTFLRQLETTLGPALDRGVRIVSNAGGLNPAGLAAAISALAGRLGLNPRIGYLSGDDVRDQVAEHGLGKPLAANAYLGGWGIADCLAAGADIVVTGRVTDASLVLGPAAAHFGWGRQDFDQLAGAVVAGHVLECGTQATGGNYPFFTEIADLRRPGFPIAELYPDGSAVITKHPGTGGAVSIGTVTAQLLYEIAGPRYAGPDVTSRFDTIQLRQDGPDRVLISGVTGEPPPPSYKVSLNSIGGYRNEVRFVLTGLDIEAKAELVRRQLAGIDADEVAWTLARTDHPDADSEEQASATLRCVVRSPDEGRIGRKFSDAAVQLALGSYPGCHLAEPPGPASPFGVFEPGYLPVSAVRQLAVLPDGSSQQVAPVGSYRELAELPEPQLPASYSAGPTRRLPLGTVLGARSGDKGGSANLGIWVREPRMYGWLLATLTESGLRTLLPELAELPIHRYLLPNLTAMNFVIDGLLGRGVGYQARFDPQAKGLAEWLRSRTAEIPEEFLP